MVAIEKKADWLLQEKGIAFRDDKKALSLWKATGAEVKSDIVCCPADLVHDLCKTAPTQFTQYARNPKRNITIGRKNSVFAPVYGPPFVYDMDGGRHYGTIADFENLVKLTYMLPFLHHSGFVTCEPCDVPVNKRHLDMLYCHMRFSDKPHLGAITTQDRAEDSVAMARLSYLAISYLQ